MAMGEYHDMDNVRVFERVNAGLYKVASQREQHVPHCEPAPRYLIQPFDI